MRWTLPCHDLDLARHALILGVLNTTPDSFSDGGSWLDPEAAVAHGIKMHRAGAAILDVGGESTRPGATAVSEEEEMRRVIPVIRALSQRCDALISVDTRKPEVARAAIASGASIVNDVGGLRDPRMRALVRETRAGAIAMHMRGVPESMQDSPEYADPVREIRSFFEHTMEQCVSEGISPAQLVFDPGIGFGKTPHHNLLLLKNLESLRTGNRPLAVGVSRKSFLGTINGTQAIEDRLWPTVALTAYCRAHGASLVRVHDVTPNHQALRMMESIEEVAL